MRSILFAGFLLLLAAPVHAAPITGESAKLQRIPDAVWAGMQGKSYRSEIRGCAQRDELVLLTVPYWNYQGQAKLGELVVHKTAGADVLDVFKSLFKDKSYAFERIELIDTYGGDDRASMTANNTSAYNCRVVAGSNRLSSHARGLAIDINPSTNPFVTSKLTSPPGSEAFDSPAERDAAKNKPGMILRNGELVKAFAAKGWTWGGNWRSIKDYQHFSKDGK